MKNKLLSIILALFMIIPCAFALTACNKPEEPDISSGQITETEWKEEIRNDDFELNYGNYMAQFIGSNGTYIPYWLELYNDDYLINDGAIENGSQQRYYYKNASGTETTYQQIEEKYDHDTHTWYWDINSIDEATYGNNINDVLAVINYIHDNQSKFSYGQHSFDGGASSFVGYKLTIADSEIATNISNIETQMRLTDYATEWILVQKYIDSVYISFMKGTDQIFRIYFGDISVFDYTYENMFNSMTNYTLVGGPSETDVDYCNIEFTADGFHVYFPNRGTMHSDKEFYAKDNGDGTFTKYTPDNAGGWTTSPLTENTYNETLNGTIKMYFGNIQDVSKAYYFRWKDGKIVNAVDFNGNEHTFTMSIGKYTYTYSNYEISVDVNNQITQMTWNMQIHDSSINADSLVYNLTLTTGNTTIEYPQV